LSETLTRESKDERLQRECVLGGEGFEGTVGFVRFWDEILGGEDVERLWRGKGNVGVY